MLRAAVSAAASAAIAAALTASAALTALTAEPVAATAATEATASPYCQARPTLAGREATTPPSPPPCHRRHLPL